MNLLDITQKYGTPLYVYEADVIDQRIAELQEKIGIYPKTEFLYAIKTNFNPHIVKRIVEKGLGIDAVSLEEVKIGLKCGCPIEKIMYTESSMSDEEMHEAHALGVLVNFGSLSRLEKYGKAYPGSRVSVRFNPNVGAASHATNITGGPLSKFGISYKQIEEVLSIVNRYGLKLVGIHEHIGSGWLGTAEPLAAMEILLDIAKELPDLEFVDCGGGFGVPYKPDQEALDMETLGIEFNRKFSEFCKEYGRELVLRFEPGRYVVAEAGKLLVEVTDLKENPEGRVFAGVNSGMNHLVRVAMYGAYHPITNISNPDGTLKTYDVVGNICENADFFAKDREIAEIREGDVLSIDIAGGYGFVMANQYQFRGRPAEVLLENGEAKIIRERETFEDLFSIYKI